MKIYSAGTKTFNNNGLGHIEFIKCIERKRKSLNGWSVECCVDIKYEPLIVKDNIVVIVTKEKGAQPFVINNPEITDTINFTADHVIFTSQRYLLEDVRPTNLIANDFLEYINKRTDTASPFSIYSDIPAKNTKYFIRKNLLEALEIAEEVFGGTYDIDGYNVNLLSNLGKISGVNLLYGKNIESAKKYENWDDVCTKILPVGPDELLLPEKYLIADVKYELPYTRTVAFDIVKEKEDGTAKTDAEMIVELRALAKAYLEQNKYPKINYTIEANVEQSLCIGDIVPVKHPNVNIKLDVQAYEYDVGLKRTTKIEYGNYERSVKKAFGEIKNQIQNIETKTETFLTQAKNEVFFLMNVAGKNGSVVFRKNDKGVIYEILCMDSDNIETAKTVMRLNSQGIAGTDKGINGAFNSAVLANGTIVADAIKTGTLRAIQLIGNTISGGNININNKFIVDSNGNMTVAGDGKFKGSVTGSAITGGSINGTTIETDKDLKVGDNIYLGENEGRIKGIYFSDTTYISKYQQNNKNALSLYSDESTSIKSINGGTMASVMTSTQSSSSVWASMAAHSGEKINTFVVYPTKTESNVQISIASDKRLKENIKEIDVNWINNLHVVSFDYIDGAENQIGLIAQPYADKEYSKYFISKNNNGFYTIAYGNITNALIKYCQQLEKRISILEEKLKERNE